VELALLPLPGQPPASASVERPEPHQEQQVPVQQVQVPPQSPAGWQAGLQVRLQGVGPTSYQ
jgi:hypothetical protein